MFKEFAAKTAVGRRPAVARPRWPGGTSRTGGIAYAKDGRAGDASQRQQLRPPKELPCR